MKNDADSSPSHWLGAALVVIALIGFYRLGIVHDAQEPEDMVLVPAGEFFAGRASFRPSRSIERRSRSRPIEIVSTRRRAASRIGARAATGARASAIGIP